jgi:hypothetical protein
MSMIWSELSLVLFAQSVSAYDTLQPFYLLPKVYRS